jgi:hypothetical protein
MRRAMRLATVLLLAAALGLASAFLVACGDRNNLIPRNDAAGIVSDLDSAKTDFSAQECRLAFADLARAKSKAAALPSSVDAKLRANVRENLLVVDGRVHQQCGKGQTTTTTSTATTPTATTPTTTATTPPTTTTTAPPPTTTTTAPPPTTDGGNSGGLQPPGQLKKQLKARAKAARRRLRKHHGQDGHGGGA